MEVYELCLEWEDKWNSKSLRKNISIVTQDITLFDDTVKNNIIYGQNSIDESSIIAALEKSYSLEFVNEI